MVELFLFLLKRNIRILNNQNLFFIPLGAKQTHERKIDTVRYFIYCYFRDY